MTVAPTGERGLRAVRREPTARTRRRAWRRAGKALAGTVVVGFVVLQVFPIVWVAVSSFKTAGEIAGGSPFSLPHGLFLHNYVTALTESDLPRYLLNSAIVALLTIGSTIALGAPAAFAIEKLTFRHGQKVLSYFLIGIMIPIFVSLLPMFQAYRTFGLLDTYAALVIPQVGFNLPICIYLYCGFMRYIPDSLLEAAQLDGAGPWRAFRSIALPLARNTTVTVVIFNFLFVWNEFVFANTFVTDPKLKTLPVGLNDFLGEWGSRDWGATYAAIMISVLPTLVLYFFLNRRVIEGVTAGAVRGG